MEKILPKIEHTLSREGLFARWLAVEAALAKAQGDLGIIPKQAAEAILDSAKVENLDMERYDELYKKTGHPMVSMLKLLEAAAGTESGQYIHLGATTQDIIDTAMVLALKETMDAAEEKLDSMIASVSGLAEKYADTLMMGRTHNIQALPVTFGYKAAVWGDELSRCRDRLRESKKRIPALQLSGAVGSMVSFGSDGLAIQERMAEELGLLVPRICWHASRDRYGEFACDMALIASALGRIAQEVYLLMGSEYGELSEYWGEGRVGSSTMPHKVNPTNTQHMLARASHVRYACAEILELMMVDHERNMQHFIGERRKMEEICLDVAALLDYGDELLSTLVVNEDKMLLNVNLLGGLTQSEHIMLELGKKIGKQNAHALVNEIAVRSFLNQLDFVEELCKNTDITNAIGQEQIRELLNPAKYIGDCPRMAREVSNALKNEIGISNNLEQNAQGQTR